MILALLIGLILGYLFIFLFEKGLYFFEGKYKKELSLKLKGYHFHHSLYGVALLLVWILTFNLLFLGVGIGVIVRHTQEEKKFAFIDRIKLSVM